MVFLEEEKAVLISYSSNTCFGGSMGGNYAIAVGG